MALSEFFTQRIKRRVVRHLNTLHVARMALRVARHAPPAQGAPVAFFKASSGIDDLSWNSAFHLLSSWALRLRGIPVAFFACRSGMSRCILGTDRDDPSRPMPCRSCIYQARALYAGVPAAPAGRGTQAAWFDYRRDADLAAALAGLPLEALMRFEWQAVPLGALCLPGLRWVLRRHHLSDDDATRTLLREFILSAWSVARQFTEFLDAVQPRALVVFNGQFFPEATACYLARQRGMRVITHEVGLQPATAFFTEGEATIYPITIPESFEMSTAQNARLDEYLARRFQGDFTMAGVRFWPGMRGLDQAFLQKASSFRQIVPIFTNVIFDTSQPHANTLFEDMFAWLDMALEVIRAHPETLFVIRAHPDELRLRKSSRETVAGWVAGRAADHEPNVIFVGPNEPLSSYELIQRSKFVMVYNSTIGLEATIMGAAVLCAGKARYTQYPTVFYPHSAAALRAQMEEFLSAGQIEVPAAFRRNARRFLYYQLFRTSLPFGDFLEPSVRTTQTRLKRFDLKALSATAALQVILEGILENGDFLLKE